MKKAFTTVLVAVLLTTLCGFAFAGQDQRLTATKIADTLAQFPAPSNAQRDKLAEEVLGLGELGITEIARMLVPAGEGNDTAARFALNAVAAYAGRFGMEPKRALTERALIGALNAASAV